MYTFCILFYFYFIFLIKLESIIATSFIIVSKMQHHRVTNHFLLAFHRCLHLPRHRLPLFQCPLLLRRPLRLLKFIFFLRSELAFNIGAFLKSKLSRQEFNPYCKKWKLYSLSLFLFCSCFVVHTFVQTFLDGGKEQEEGLFR